MTIDPTIQSKGYTVLSLFDGMSCGQIALKKLGIKVFKYFASEIKPHAIRVTKHNFPDTIHIGDVRNVSYNDGVLTTENGIFEVVFDLVIGGSPCQDLSILMSDRKGLAGDNSSLFWHYHRILNEVNPTYFMLENVASMDITDATAITKALGVDGIRINSSLVSAQLRDRIYWTNIPGCGVDLFSQSVITQPKDKSISLQSVLESGYTDRDKALCLTARGGGRWQHILDDKSKTEKVQKQLIDRYMKGFDNIVYEQNYVRLLSQKEQERLQTVPEGYTNILSYVEASNVIGDGWTVDVVVHLFKGLKQVA